MYNFRTKRGIFFAFFAITIINLSYSLAFSNPIIETKGDFFHRREEGWFWYDDPDLEDILDTLEEIAQEEDQEEKVADIKQEHENSDNDEHTTVILKDAKDVTEPFSVKWLKEWMPVLQVRAIDMPTTENIEAYEYAKRVALDKAQVYAEKTREVVANDPFLDENNRVPLATFAKKAFLSNQDHDIDAALKHLSGTVGIWMFFDSTCSFCHIQSRTIQQLEKEFGFYTTYISVDGSGMEHLEQWNIDEGQANALGLKITPTTVLVVPPNKFFVISQGAMAYDQLQERILIAASSNDLLPEDIKKGVDIFNNGILTTEDMQDGATDDPAVWVQRLKERLQVRY